MSTAVASSANSQAQGVRQPVRQTRTNPSRTSKTLGRSSFAFGHSSVTDAPPTPPIPHGFYPALTHFTDAVAALPREFRRHNSLLKEVDAKAWALEENLLQLLKSALDSEPVPCPPNPAPIMDGVIREDAQPKVCCFDSGEGLTLLLTRRPFRRMFLNHTNRKRARIAGCSSTVSVIP